MLALVCASEAAAQPWKPTRNVEIIVGSGPGGGADITGRLMQKLFQEKLLPEVATSVVRSLTLSTSTSASGCGPTRRTRPAAT